MEKDIIDLLYYTIYRIKNEYTASKLSYCIYSGFYFIIKQD